ncbi:MAG: nuclear transport factor 2 family protein [Phycisphaerales bacterium]
MMLKTTLVVGATLVGAGAAGGCAISQSPPADDRPLEARLGERVDRWHEAAATGDWETYASLMTDDVVFLGTDKTERWVGRAFEDFARPYFDGPTEYGEGAWTYEPLSRTVEVRGDVAWWDEVLRSASYGHCRGTGVLVRGEDGAWRIAHYALAFLIPNEIAADVTRQGLDFEAATREAPGD